MNCYKCGKPMKEVRSNFTFPTPVGNVDIADVSYRQCESCGEIIFSLEEAKFIEKCCHAFIEGHAWNSK